MTRLAKGRDTHLSRPEIAAEALRQFDRGQDPSIRSIAGALGVNPSAIYHHYASRTELVQGAADLVCQEIPRDTFAAVGDGFEGDPVEILVASGLATRRAFARHHLIAPYMAGTPQPDAIRGATLTLVADLLERLGLRGEEAVAAFHAYASYVIGAALFVAVRRSADQGLARFERPGQERVRTRPGPRAPRAPGAATRAALDTVMDLSTLDPDRDEALFAQGLRRLIASFTPGGPPRSIR